MNARTVINKYLKDRNITDDIWYTVCSHYIDNKSTAVLDDFKDENGKYLLTENDLRSEMKAFISFYQKMNNSIKWKYTHTLDKIDELVKEFEETAAIKLPIWYIYLVRKYNRGRPNLDTIDINGREITLKSFITFEKDTKESIWTFSRDNGIVFANDNFGNAFCFNTTGSGITFINHETDEKFNVCESFIEFIQMLS